MLQQLRSEVLQNRNRAAICISRGGDHGVQSKTTQPPNIPTFLQQNA
jgi:hypothetical protein